jgi:hypothetical protein
MENIMKKFNKIKSIREGWSDLAIFNIVISETKTTESNIRKGLSKLVDKDDFKWVSKDDVLNYVISIKK